MISLVIDNLNFDDSVFKDVYESSTADEIGRFLQKFSETEKDLTSHEFAIPIEYKIALTKKDHEGDITISSSSTGGKAAVIVQVPKDVNVTHPFLQGDAIKEINNKIHANPRVVITSFDFQAILHKEKVRSSKSSRYYYLIERPITHRYSLECIEMIADKLNADPTYRDRCRDSFSHHQKSKRQKYGSRRRPIK